MQSSQENGITTKKVIIDDIDLFFTKYVEATRQGLPSKKEDDMMI